MKKLNGDSIMQFGKFLGRKLEDVPTWYLLYWNRERSDQKLYGFHLQLFLYIEDNLESLEKENTI